MVPHGRGEHKSPTTNDYVFVFRNVDFGRFGKNEDRVKILMDALYQRTLQPDREFHDWVPMSQRYRRKLLGRRHHDIVLDICLDAKLIQYAEMYKYAPGHHSKRFRLDRRLWYRDWIVESLKTRQVAKQMIGDDWPDAYRYAAEAAMRVQVANVPEGAIDYAVVEAFEEKQRKVTPEELGGMYRQMIQGVQYGMIRCIMDDHGRLHTPITSLPRRFRDFLTLDGEPLAGVDIRSSQPLFFGLAASEYFLGSSLGTHKGIGPGSGVVGSAEVGGVGRWLGMCAEVDFYDFLRTRVGFDGSRDRFKEEFFRELYGPNLEETRLLTHLRDNFPEIVDFIFEVKQVPRLWKEWRALREAQSYPQAWAAFQREFRPVYGRLACQMQSAEADFVFGRVVPRLQEMGVPAVTIHDAVLAPQQYQTTIREVVEDEFRKIGVSAQLHDVGYGRLGIGESGGDDADPAPCRRSGGSRVRRDKHSARRVVQLGPDGGEDVAA